MPTTLPSILSTSQAESADIDTPDGSAVIVSSHRLLQGRPEILIRHGNEIYRLRHTRNDKLILTK